MLKQNLKEQYTEGLPGSFPSRKRVMSVKGTECGELSGVMYVKRSVLKRLQGEYSVHASQKVEVRDILDWITR